MERELFGEDQQPKQKKIIFGLDKHKMKSTGECSLWLCCKRCEGIMTQNAESDFSQKFPSSGSVDYESWLFNFCCSTIFRALSCVKFPRGLNDDEVYDAFLFCRKYLLSLPCKSIPNDPRTSESQAWQLQLLETAATKQIEPYIFITPVNVEIDSKRASHTSMAWLASHRLIDGRKDMSGHSHFFIVYCKRIAILLPFCPSNQLELPKKFKISPQRGTYSIPSDREALELIPKGLWMVHRRYALKSLSDTTEVIQQLPPRAKFPFRKSKDSYSTLSQGSSCVSSVPTTTSLQEPNSHASKSLTLLPKMHSDKLHQSLLPREFVLCKSALEVQVKIPHNHHIVQHQEMNGVTIFLAISNLLDPYVLFMFDNENSPVCYVDGAYLSESDSEIVFKNYLLENALSREIRTHVEDLNVLEIIKTLLTLLMRKHFLTSLKVLIHHFKNLSIRIMKGMVSLDIKCAPEDKCWYCKNLCHCCMKPAVLTDSDNSTSQFKFCSRKCKNILVLRNPGYVTVEHLKELDSGTFKGPSILDVVNIRKDDEKKFSIIDFISLCLADGSGDLAQGELYVLWQIRSLKIHIYMSIHITEECLMLEILESTLLEKQQADKLESLVVTLQPLLLELFTHSVQSLGFQSIASYVIKFK